MSTISEIMNVAFITIFIELRIYEIQRFLARKRSPCGAFVLYE